MKALEKKNIRTASAEEIKNFLLENKEKPFRAKQIDEWLWKKAATNFEDMSNLSQSLRELLTANFCIPAVKIAEEQRSEDGTIKDAFQLYDGKVVEGVLIPSTKRMTACISSQAGCSLTCKFCGTGKLKMLRNLGADEIYDQVVHIKKQAEQHYQKPLSNIVYMGMGEPLLNYKNVLESIDKVCSNNGLGMSPKRITLSTAGISKMIKKLGDDQVKFNLAVSLHAANDKKRNELMPINESNSLDSLAEALRYFQQKTDSRITFEYIIFNNFNDELIDAEELAAFCKNVACKINIIEYNPIDGGPYQQAAPKKVDAFARFLESKHLIVNIRRSRGKDIDAACGQLANKNKLKGAVSKA
jgi:23S rRNA (adenine2503-C2)-methyltransferase